MDLLLSFTKHVDVRSYSDISMYLYYTSLQLYPGWSRASFQQLHGQGDARL